MSVLLKTQRASIAESLKRHGLNIKDFERTETDQQFRLEHKDTGYFLTMRPNFNRGGGTLLTFTPGFRSALQEQQVLNTWVDVTRIIERWCAVLVEERDADDPWEESREQEGQQRFQDSDSKFTADELPLIDAAVDRSFEKLLSVAKERGIEKDIKSIETTVKFLKDEARRQTRGRWFDIFLGAVLGRLIEWGLSPELLNPVLNVLLESVKPMLQIVA